MLVLGIETTCDETAAAVVERRARRAWHASCRISCFRRPTSMRRFGGVVPEIAARAHVEVLDRIISKAMTEACCAFENIDGVAAAAGPGLIGGVIVGLTTAKAIALVGDMPLMAVNHLEAHALTARLTDNVSFPYCLFLASGGHTQIVAVRGVGDYVLLGNTVDDAIGEAFDKTAKLLGLGYPGGPQVEQRGRARRLRTASTCRGRCMGGAMPNFSLSGLKTALRLEAEKIAPLSRSGRRGLVRGVSAGGGRRRRGSHPRGPETVPRPAMARRPRLLPPAVSPPTRRPAQSAASPCDREQASRSSCRRRLCAPITAR